MKRFAVVALKRIIKALLYGVVGAGIVLVIVGINFLNDKPDLQVWHTAQLDEEFTSTSKVATLTDYLALETRLFVQLGALIYDEFDPAEITKIQRFSRGSLADPTSWETNWNRTFELPVTNPRAGVLLLHGLSDSPYSLRRIGEQLQREGYHVLGLRIPGHGTAPVGLTRVKWEDMAAAVRLGMRHLESVVGEKPINTIGYSNGGALAVNYALDALEDSSLPQFQRIALISPEIGVSPVAAFAVWQERAGRLLGLEKLRWNSVLPEYDPFKYGSFAVNAGRQAHDLTIRNREHLRELSANNGLLKFPPTLTFQSAVDATVSVKALVHDFYEQLPSGNHELVAYDLNRTAKMENLLRRDPQAGLKQLEDHAHRRYILTVVSNVLPDNEVVVARTHLPMSEKQTDFALADSWPHSIYSLAHVALPFARDDPTYGRDAAGDPSRIQLGKLAFRGEKNVLTISAADMLRIRWNPFFEYQIKRILVFFDQGLSPE